MEPTWDDPRLPHAHLGQPLKEVHVSRGHRAGPGRCTEGLGHCPGWPLKEGPVSSRHEASLGTWEAWVAVIWAGH